MSPSRIRARSPGGHRSIAWVGASVLLCIALGVVVRWPLALHPSALAGDTNFAFHALVAHHLAQGGAPTWFDLEPFPQGFPLAVVAVVPTFLAAILALFTDPVVALNLLLPVNIALQAGAVMLLAADLGWRPRAQAMAAVAATISPVALLFSGCSQHENLAFGAFALACLAPRRTGWRAPLLGALAMLWAAFSSPYQAIPAGFLLLASSATAGWRTLRWAIVVTALAALPVWSYYARIGGSAAASRAGMPTIGMEVSADLNSLLSPIEQRREQRLPLIEGAKGRVRLVSHEPPTVQLGEAWPSAPLRDTPYLGLALLTLGLAGLYRGRRERPIQVVAAVGLICFLLALGSSLRLTRAYDTGLPLPWRALRDLPLLHMLSTTVRFLTGVAFALALGAGRLVAGTSSVRGRALAAGGALLLAFDALLLAPVNWPVAGFFVQLPPSAKELPPGPVAVWPGLQVLTTHHFDILTLVLDRPVAYYGELRAARPGEGDTYSGLSFTSSQEPPEWLAEVRAAGARGWLRLEHPLATGLFQDTSRKPWFFRGEERCEGGWCVGSFDQDEGEGAP